MRTNVGGSFPASVVLIIINAILIGCLSSAEQVANSSSSNSSGSSCIVRLSAGATATGKWSDLPAPFNGFCSYVGVGYAQPPLGALRFEPPQENTLWTGERHFGGSATGDEPIKCLQLKDEINIEFPTMGSEDCLYLDVHVPMRRGSAVQPGLPVLVWIHGGSFNAGWTSKHLGGPDNFVEQDIIVVAINYRLAALGFLSIPAANIAGNMGLLDQRMALRWVHQHIGAFGGDAERVTLMGWSAGAASVGYHMTSGDDVPLLFHRAIMMSGSSANPWAVQNDNSECTRNLLANAGLNNTPAAELKARLQQIDAHQLIIANFSQDSFKFFGSMEYGFVPTVDERYVRQAPHVWLLDNRTDAIRIPQRPLLIGGTSVEIASNVDFSWRDVRWPPDTGSPFGRREEILQMLTELMRVSNYPVPKLNDAELMLEKKKIRLFFDSMTSLVALKYSIWRFADRYQLLTGGCKPIVYQFGYAGMFGEFRTFLPSFAEGPVHGDDLGYLFGRRSNVSADKVSKEYAEAQAVRERLVLMWSDFIKSETLNTEQCDNPATASKSVSPLMMIHIDSETSQLPLAECQQSPEFRLWDAAYRCLYVADCGQLFADYLHSNRTLLDIVNSEPKADERCRLWSNSVFNED